MNQKTEEKEFKKIENQITYWNPSEDGNEIVGTVEQIRDSPEFGRTVILRCEDNLIGLPSHTVLSNLLMNVRTGETIKVVHTGEKEARTPGFKPTQLYNVYVREV